MRFIKIFSCLIFSAGWIMTRAQAPRIVMLESMKGLSLRGLSVVTDNILWVSGNKGMVGKSTDAGKHVEWIKVTGFENRDFRDIEAFDENTALIMGVDAPAIILKTGDGGKTWKKVLEDSTKGMFLDAMHFDGDQRGVVIGDPIQQKPYLAFTEDQGEHWDHSSHQNPPIDMKKVEAFFASSGTNIVRLHQQIAFVSGGKASRIFWGTTIDSIPIIQGQESTGANSIALIDQQHAVIVGGDFKQDTVSKGNCVLYDHQIRNFKQPIIGPHGYRSCVINLGNHTLICCGTSGMDISYDGGINWSLISTESFHVIQQAKKGDVVYMAGAKGRIAKLQF